MLALALAAPARAQRPAPWSPPARSDTAAVAAPVTPAAAASDSTAAASDSTARPRRQPPKARTGLFEQPRFIMLRSAVVPGWGQLHNGSWIKALGVAGAEVWLGTHLLDDWRALDDLDAEVAAARLAGDIPRENEAVGRYNARLDTSVRRQWLLAGVLTYALLDAYVDAHFRDFKFEFETDPALPGGASRGARVSIGWGF